MTGFIARKCSGGAQGSVVGGDEDYSGALKASALFWHAQRSGALTDTLISWRDDSGLADVPVGGFYQGSSAPPALAQEAFQQAVRSCTPDPQLLHKFTLCRRASCWCQAL